MKLRINRVSLIVTICIILLILSLAPIPIASYCDDLVAALLAIPAVLGVIYRRYTKEDFRIVFLLLFMLFWGIISNLVSGLVNNPFYWANDAFSFLRSFFCYFGILSLLYGDLNKVKSTIRYIALISKLFLLTAILFGIFNILGIVDMYSSIRFGIKNYCFFFGNASQFGITVGVAMAFILLDSNSSKIYEVIGIILLIMTAKGTSITIAVVYVILYFFSLRKIIWWHVVIGLASIVFFIKFQIK